MTELAALIASILMFCAPARAASPTPAPTPTPAPITSSNWSPAMIVEIEGNPELAAIARNPTMAKTLRPKDRIETGDKLVISDGQATDIQLSEGTRVILGPISSFRVESVTELEPQRTTLSLFYGRAYINVRRAYGKNEFFALETPAGAVSVRDPDTIGSNEFFIDFDRARRIMKIEVIKGRVIAAKTTKLLLDHLKSGGKAAGVLTVQSGQFIAFETNIPVPAKPEPAADFKEWASRELPLFHKWIYFSPDALAEAAFDPLLDAKPTPLPVVTKGPVPSPTRIPDLKRRFKTFEE